MNAYELADAITNCTTDPLHNDAANMLRQQADRIAELEKQYRFGVDWGKDDKSVTVVKIHEDGVAEIVFVDYQERPTPQTKPLNDEEIAKENLRKLNLALGSQKLSDEEIIAIRDSCYVQSGIDEWEFDDINFARAIEERHGIK